MISNKNSFTVIELLVVVAIIALISSIFLVYVKGVREEARDARRLSDIHIIETALDLYYVKYGEYPSVDGIAELGGWDAGNVFFDEYHTFIEPLVEKGIMSRVPVDPNPKMALVSPSPSYGYFRYKEEDGIEPCGRKPFIILAAYLERGKPDYVVSRVHPCYNEAVGTWWQDHHWYVIMKIE